MGLQLPGLPLPGVACKALWHHVSMYQRALPTGSMNRLFNQVSTENPALPDAPHQRHPGRAMHSYPMPFPLPHTHAHLPMPCTNPLAGLNFPYPQRNFDMEFSFSWLWILLEVPRLFLGEKFAAWACAPCPPPPGFPTLLLWHKRSSARCRLRRICHQR